MFYIFKCVKEVLTLTSDAKITTIFMIDSLFLRGFESKHATTTKTIYTYF